MTRIPAFAALALLVLGACSSSDSPTSPTPALTANIVQVIQGDGQTDTVGQQLPTAIRIEVLDTSGPAGAGAFGRSAGTPTPVPGQLVNFVVTSGGGHVFAGAALTDSLGHAQELWTLGPSAGSQCMEARAVDPSTGDPLTFATVCATGVPGPLAHVGFTADTIVIPGDSILRLPAFATDQYNNPLPVPTPSNPDALGLTSDSLGWKTVPGTVGWGHFILGTDTLVVAEHLPRGRYRIAYHHADTAWVETGVAVWPNAGGTQSWCTAGSSGSQLPGYTGARLRMYASDSVWITRQIGAGTVDTVGNNNSAVDYRACSAVSYGGPAGPPAFRLRLYEYLTGGGSSSYLETDLTQQIAPFTWVMPPGGGRADTLWFGLP